MEKANKKSKKKSKKWKDGNIERHQKYQVAEMMTNSSVLTVGVKCMVI